MLTFEEMRESVGEGGRISVLLGNGFSRAWRDEPFCYETLYQAAKFGEREAEIRQVFDVLATQDFEKVTNRLRASRDIIQLYSDDAYLLAQLDNDAEKIKEVLLTVIAETHPSRPNEIATEDYEHVRVFMSAFASIYTVNYDLLMYWARNQRDILPEDWNTDDGFRTEQLWFGPETDQEVFFLHGALHLYEASNGVKKHSFSESGEAIVNKVQENLRANMFPLFVSEPTADAKLSRINRNPYLSYCLRQLGKEDGCLFVFGHGFADVDRHIFTTIDASNINHVFVALHGDLNNEDNRRIKGAATAWLQTDRRQVSFVNAQTVPVWRGV